MQRKEFLQQVELLFKVNPIVAILGPRQCGKTTLAKDFANEINNLNFFDLEDPVDYERLKNPKLALENLEGLIIIDEIQRLPDLFPVLRVLIDNKRDKQKYLILGSASRELIKQSSETLAGRISYLELTPFKISEAINNNKNTKDLWLRGGYPRSFLAINDEISYKWRNSYIKTYLEQDVPALGFGNINPNELRRFWTMLAHFHGQIFNASQIANSLDISNILAKKYLDILAGTFMVRILQPWHENIKKRQVKSPKIFFKDSGIYHALLRYQTKEDVSLSPQLGASWEGFALEEIIRQNSHNIDDNDCYFWSTQSGAELDLLIVNGNKKIGYEFKYSDAPRTTKSMHISINDLNLDKLNIIYPGNKEYQLDEKIFVKKLL